ncbi:MAG: adenylate/guanylate cyclase domain-containing protein [Actinobacteria bacterium]|nr:adenylate/guanylate cyclase domain-containing protein [Actinomycetota bacterium]
MEGTGSHGFEESEAWRETLVEGHRKTRIARSVFGKVPSAPRCKICANPFGGFGGKVFALAGFRPSKKNPNVCSRCCDGLPPGGAEVDVGVLFVDVRGSTEMGEDMSATAFAGAMTEFYKTATAVLLDHDAVIDKLLGDEVMALFVRGIAGPEYRRRTALAAVDLARAVALPAGVAAHAGDAFVGNVGADGVVDFTALGDTVNTSARLQEHAADGEVILSAEVFVEVADRFPDALARTVEVRGRTAPIEVRVVRP